VSDVRRRGARPESPPWRRPANRPEWERVVQSHRELPLPAIGPVLLLGSFMRWPPGVEGRPKLDTLLTFYEDRLEKRALQGYLSAAVRCGLLIIRRRSSPSNPTVYDAGVPTGEASPVLTLGDARTFDTCTPVHVSNPPELVDTCTPVHVNDVDTCTPTQQHVHRGAPYPTQIPDRGVLLDVGDDVSTASRSAPLLAVLTGSDHSAGPSAVLHAAPTLADGQAAAARLAVPLPAPLAAQVTQRWRVRVARTAVSLLAAGWPVDELVATVHARPWDGVVNAGAVLASRCEELLAAPVPTSRTSDTSGLVTSDSPAASPPHDQVERRTIPG
jgi:hypothetical protein